MQQHASNDEAHEHVCELLDEAKDGKWMAVVYWIDEDQKIQMRRTTCEFNPNDFPACVRMLKEGCVNELFGDTKVKPPTLPRISLLDGDNGVN